MGKMFYRQCYRCPFWKHKIGHPDGFARAHWQEDKAAVERSIEIIRARGCEAFIEELETD